MTRPPVLDDLKPGVSVRHVPSELTGMILPAPGGVVVQWDNSFTEERVSLEGPLFPSSFEIITSTA